jgi:hypothetical protein
MKKTPHYIFWWNWDWTWGFVLAKLALYHFSHTSSPFCSGYCGDGVSHTSFPGWPQIMSLSISTSEKTRITGVSHRCPAKPTLFKWKQFKYVERFSLTFQDTCASRYLCICKITGCMIWYIFEFCFQDVCFKLRFDRKAMKARDSCCMTVQKYYLESRKHSGLGKLDGQY